MKQQHDYIINQIERLKAPCIQQMAAPSIVICKNIFNPDAIDLIKSDDMTNDQVIELLSKLVEVYKNQTMKSNGIHRI